MSGKAWAFAVYSIAFESIVWGGWFWIVFVLEKSAWWTVLAFVLSFAQNKAESFGIKRVES